MAKASIQIRLDPDLLDWLDEQSRKEERSRSWFVNCLVRKAFLAQDSGEQLLSATNLRNC